MYYGYIVMAILCFDYFIMLCGSLYTFGSYVIRMTEELSMSMAQASFGQTLVSLGSAVVGFIIGQLLNVKFSPKSCLLAGAVAGTVGSAIMVFFVQGPVLFWICCGLLFSTMNMCGSNVASQVIATSFFPKNRSTALAVLMTSGGVGGFVFPTLTAELIRRTDSWRSIWYVVGIGCVLCFVITLLFLRDQPNAADRRHPAYGGVPDEAAGTAASAGFYTRNEALRTPYFYALCAMMICTSLCVYSMTNTEVTSLVDRGIDPLAASKALSLYSAGNIIGRLSAGPILDRMDVRKIYRVCMAGAGICFIFLPMVQTAGAAQVLSLCTGLFVSFCVMSSMTAVISAYGLPHYSRIFSIQYMVNTFVNAGMMLVAGLVRDNMGTYVPYYRFVCIAVLAVAVLYCLTPVPQKKKIPENV